MGISQFLLSYLCAQWAKFGNPMWGCSWLKLTVSLCDLVGSSQVSCWAISGFTMYKMELLSLPLNKPVVQLQILYVEVSSCFWATILDRNQKSHIVCVSHCHPMCGSFSCISSWQTLGVQEKFVITLLHLLPKLVVSFSLVPQILFR